MNLPEFRYHPDSIRSGSVEPLDATCRCCRKARGFIYTGPVYAEKDLSGALCPWCIADGSAHEKFDATFVDSEAFPDDVPESAIEEITERTPGYSAWQGEQWPACCGDAARFLRPTGLAQIRAEQRELEGLLMGHIVHEMGISGGAATRLLASLDRDKGPTAYIFECRTCGTPKFHIDQP
jgi:uncharacterized protein CbrC (UPF0167 family)